MDTQAPKHARVLEHLRRLLKGTAYPAGSRLPTELELARSLQVNALTVSRALRELVAEGLIVRRRGSGTYVADRQAPPLLAGRHLRVGLLWPVSVRPERLVQSWWGALTRGVLEAWNLTDVAPSWSVPAAAAFTRAVWDAPASGLTLEALGEALPVHPRHPPLEAVRAGRFDALITVNVVEPAYLESLLELKLPTVLLDFDDARCAGRADQVCVDPLDGYRAAVQAFAAQGLQRIHYVGGVLGAPAPSETLSGAALNAFVRTHTRVEPDSVRRQHAYRVAMDELNLPVREDWIHRLDVGAREAANLAQSWAQQPDTERPEALLCFNLDQAEALQQACADHGLSLEAAGVAERLPRGAAHAIRIDGVELGRIGAALALARLQQPHRPTVRVGVPTRYLAHTEGLTESVNAKERV